jgi:hypothetical protein
LLQVAERMRLTDALSAASRHEKVGLHFNKGLAGTPEGTIKRLRPTLAQL